MTSECFTTIAPLRGIGHRNRLAKLGNQRVRPRVVEPRNGPSLQEPLEGVCDDGSLSSDRDTPRCTSEAQTTGNR